MDIHLSYMAVLVPTAVPVPNEPKSVAKENKDKTANPDVFRKNKESIHIYVSYT
jgi:hypothetical protein